MAGSFPVSFSIGWLDDDVKSDNYPIGAELLDNQTILAAYYVKLADMLQGGVLCEEGQNQYMKPQSRSCEPDSIIQLTNDSD